MSTRYEGAAAEWTHITVHPAGTELADDEVSEGNVAVAFNYDEVFYVVGTPEDVRSLLQAALDKLKEATG